MSSRKSKKLAVLKVHVSFETSRVADECLADAYEQVVPLVRRVTASGSQLAAVDSDQIRRTVEGGSRDLPSDSAYYDSVTNS